MKGFDAAQHIAPTGLEVLPGLGGNQGYVYEHERAVNVQQDDGQHDGSLIHRGHTRTVVAGRPG